jgi:hypothetical protein
VVENLERAGPAADRGPPDHHAAHRRRVGQRGSVTRTGAGPVVDWKGRR